MIAPRDCGTQATIGKADGLALLEYWASAVQDMRYEVLDRHVSPGVVVQRHVIHGTAAGVPLAADICIVIHVADGRVTRIFEYLDPATVAPVFAPSAT